MSTRRPSQTSGRQTAPSTALLLPSTLPSSAAGLAAAVVVSHLQKRVGDKEDAYDREHMVQEMQALVDRRVVPLLEAPK